MKGARCRSYVLGAVQGASKSITETVSIWSLGRNCAINRDVFNNYDVLLLEILLEVGNEHSKIVKCPMAMPF